MKETLLHLMGAFIILFIGLFFCLLYFLGFICIAIDYAMGYEGRVPVLKPRLKRMLYYLKFKTEGG